MTTAKLPFHVALVAEPGTAHPAEVAQVAAALQKQATRDLAPAWGVKAVVAAFPIDAVPPHYSPITIKRSLNEPGALGYHTTSHRQPVALIQYGHDWPLTCSHELVEMLVDPFGSRKWYTTSPAGTGERVKLLVEVGDPVEDPRFAYDIDGVKVSDFALPAWFHTVHGAPARYSFTGAATAPRQIREGGYTSFEHADGTWWQQTWFDSAQPATRQLGRLEDFAKAGESLRQAVDRATREYRAERSLRARTS